MVPTERFELSTSPLPRECSTPELCGPAALAANDLNLPPWQRSGKLPQVPLPGQAGYETDTAMTAKKSQSPLKSSAEQRQQRLAQALRDNLRRRKQQQTTANTPDVAGKRDSADASQPPDRGDGE